MSTGPYELTTQVLGPLPIINTFCDRLGLPELLETFLAHHDSRLKLAPAAGIGVVRNLVLGREPVYALGEWAAPFDPGLLGLAAGEARLLNDDRVGRGLARLFDADRASLLTRLALDAVERFGIDCSQLHNDSTSVTFAGAYPGAIVCRIRVGSVAASIRRGSSTQRVCADFRRTKPQSVAEIRDRSDDPARWVDAARTSAHVRER